MFLLLLERLVGFFLRNYVPSLEVHPAGSECLFNPWAVSLKIVCSCDIDRDVIRYDKIQYMSCICTICPCTTHIRTRRHTGVDNTHISRAQVHDRRISFESLICFVSLANKTHVGKSEQGEVGSWEHLKSQSSIGESTFLPAYTVITNRDI